jgi:hypothetical protein
MLLMLDFDGVLHPEGGTHFSRLPMLEHWLRAHPDVDVVITSAWREHESLSQLQAYFSEDLRPRIIGVTPMYHRLDGRDRSWDQANEIPTTPRQREVEIRRWVYDSADRTRPWVALDDQASLFHPATVQLVLTRPKVGLTTKNLEELDRRWRMTQASKATTPPVPRTRRP